MTTPPRRTKKEKASRIPPLVTGERLTHKPGRRPRVHFDGGLPTRGATAPGLEETAEERQMKKVREKRADHFKLDTSTLEKVPEIQVLLAAKRGK